MSAKIVPIGGEHQSIQSLLADMMQDNPAKIVVVTFDDDGIPTWGCFGVNHSEVAFAALIMQRVALSTEFGRTGDGK